MPSGQHQPLEISDLIWSVDPLTNLRLPVVAADVLERLAAGGQTRAARVVRSLPTVDGVLDPVAVDELMVRVHCELQRLGEELQLPRRVAATVGVWTAELLRQDPRSPVHVVDVGCGLGLVIRWLASSHLLGPQVKLVGVDFNGTLIREAARLAVAEGLDARFVNGDAFAPGAVVEDPERTIVISSGLLHHIPVPELEGFFAAQQNLGVYAFAHWDIDPSRWATLGSWVFHRSRMREPLSRHDGVLSARRAHPAVTLSAAGAAGAGDYLVSCADGPRWRPSLAEVLRPITGVRDQSRSVAF